MAWDNTAPAGGRINAAASFWLVIADEPVFMGVGVVLKIPFYGIDMNYSFYEFCYR